MPYPDLTNAKQRYEELLANANERKRKKIKKTLIIFSNLF
jgi:hypothetical protein